MKKKNTLPIKWMLGILIILVAIVYGTQQVSKGTAPYFFNKNRVLSPIISPIIRVLSPIIQFLANMIGIRNQNEPVLPTTPPWRGSTLPSKNPLNVEAPQGTEPIAEQGSNTAQKGINAESNPGDLSGANADQKLGNLSETNAENNPGNNSEINSKNNSEPNADQKPGNLSGANAENNPGNISGDHPGANAEQEPGNISGSNSGSNSGNTSGAYSGGCVLGCYPGCIPGCDPACKPSVCNFGNISGSNSGNTSGSMNQSNLPTINPIPTDNTVSQSIAQQNQKNDSLAALVANHQALVVPVQQQAQASKYQTVNSENIPAPSTDQAPTDAVQKMKSNQVMHH